MKKREKKIETKAREINSVVSTYSPSAFLRDTLGLPAVTS